MQSMRVQSGMSGDMVPEGAPPEGKKKELAQLGWPPHGEARHEEEPHGRTPCRRPHHPRRGTIIGSEAGVARS